MPRSYKCQPSRINRSPADLAAELQLPVRGKLREKLIIGRREWLGLPQLGVDLINAKVDTGAYTSSLHASEVEVINRDGESRVRFLTHNHRGDEIECEAALVRRKKIKSSTGKGRMRYIIMTEAEIFGAFRWKIMLSLADRSVMKCPLLLGRRALSGYFVVDTQASHLFGNVSDITGKLHHKKS